MSTIPSRRRSTLGAGVRAWAIPGLVGLGTLGAIALGENAFRMWAAEDRICEWLQVVFYLGALVEAIRARNALARSSRRGTATQYFVAVLGLVFLVGEEVSWGQRIFGWSTPEPLAEVNRQGETTLHNIGAAHDAVGWVLLAIGFWGSVLPRLLREGAALGRWRGALHPFVPDANLAPYFLPMLVWRLYRNLFPLPATYAYSIVQLNEPLELVMAIGFWQFFRSRAREFAGQSDRRPSGGRASGSTAEAHQGR
jgi:hypothetical protein